jgi:hypothetical protein
MLLVSSKTLDSFRAHRKVQLPCQGKSLSAEQSMALIDGGILQGVRKNETCPHLKQ